jgi:hypothetical protein
VGDDSLVPFGNTVTKCKEQLRRTVNTSVKGLVQRFEHTAWKFVFAAIVYHLA